MPGGRESEFTRLLEGESRGLARFILALVGDRHVADDIFQTTCLDLWQRRATFRPGTDFGAWARTVARYRVLRFWRKSGRERVAFSSDAIDRLADAVPSLPPAEDLARRRSALDACLETLASADRDLLRRRYNDGVAVKDLARETSQSEGGLKMALMRLRRRLERCVMARLAREESLDG